jgi:hypothetical protein
VPHEFGDEQPSPHLAQQRLAAIVRGGHEQVVCAAGVAGARQAQFASGVGGEEPALQDAFGHHRAARRGHAFVVEGGRAGGLGDERIFEHRDEGGEDALAQFAEQEGGFAVEGAAARGMDEVG